MSSETHRIALDNDAVIETFREGYRVTLRVADPEGNTARVPLTGHELLRVSKALEVIAMGMVTER